MRLYIDTTDRAHCVVQLLDGDLVVGALEQSVAKGHDQLLLLSIDQLLTEQGATLRGLQSIEVNTGPGSFTGTRVGVAVANALGLALNIPVNDQPAGGWVAAIYAAEPHISQPKS